LKNIKHYIGLSLSNLVIFLIKIYQNFSLFSGPTCRFIPTCSEYAIEAFKTHGFYVGLKLTIIRLSSCRPFGKSGVDPVPSTSNKGENDGY
tara:strand:+ start:354 stop:626 length:273 start_codon:yes stop_codon:yes gene_type:complete